MHKNKHFSSGRSRSRSGAMHLRGPHTVTVVICQLVPREPSTITLHTSWVTHVIHPVSSYTFSEIASKLQYLLSIVTKLRAIIQVVCCFFSSITLQLKGAVA